MDLYKIDNFKGIETKTNLGVYYLAHSMSSVGVYWCCIFHDLFRKTEATPCIPVMKDFNTETWTQITVENIRKDKVREATTGDLNQNLWRWLNTEWTDAVSLLSTHPFVYSCHSFSSTAQMSWENFWLSTMRHRTVSKGVLEKIILALEHGDGAMQSWQQSNIIT